MSKLPNIPEIDYQTALEAFRVYAHPRKALSDALRRGDLTRVKKGLYIQNSPGVEPYSIEILANLVYGPSYISYEYALSRHGMIPESVQEVTNATSGKTKTFDTPVGRFTYHHQEMHYYASGFERCVVSGERAFLMANAEKALCDRVLSERRRFSRKSMRLFLLEGLRIEEETIRNLDSGLLKTIAESGNRESLDVLVEVIKKFQKTKG